MKYQMIEPKPINANFNDQQWLAIQEEGTNLLVAASAGSGKTTVLIERILTHLRKGFAGLDQLLVVTFTESAAKEMKERMEAKLKETLVDPDKTEQIALYRTQLDLLPNAHFRTLHSFCLQVIQDYFFLIDFNPSFSLLTDETQKLLYYQNAWETLLTQIIDGNIKDISKAQLTDLLSRYANPRDDIGLFDLVRDLYLFSSSHPEPDLWLSNLHQYSANFSNFANQKLFKELLQPRLVSALSSAYQALLQAESQLSGGSDETQAKYGDLIASEREQVGVLLEYLYQADLEAFAKSLMTLDYLRWPTKPRKTEEGDLIDQVKAYRDQAKKLVTDHVQALFPMDYPHLAAYENQIAPVIQSLGTLARHFKAILKDLKRSDNLIDYNDLEHLTLEILAPYNPQTQERVASMAALHYQQQFKEILVDEYQDINEIQAAILSWLSHEHRPEFKGNLFMVGDVKQSIYGFRMAEPSLFMKKYRDYQEGKGGKLIVLDQNYRSRDEVLQFTNYIFESLMDEQFGEMAYGQKESLKTGNRSFLPPAPDPDFNVHLLLHEKEGDSAPLEEDDNHDFSGFDTAIEAQAHMIAQDIQKRIAAGWEIYDKQLKSKRKADFKDFVILTATRSPFLSLQQTFQAYQIPLNAQKVETYFQRQEIQLMIALLKLVDNSQQDLPLAAILRSYFVGLDDEALSQIRIAYKDLAFHEAVLTYSHQQNDSIAQILKTFYLQLERWTQIASQKRLVDLIWTIYQDTYFIDYVSGLSNGLQRQANLHAFYQQAAIFEQSEFKGIFGFIRYIEEVTAHQSDIAEPLILGDDDNYVRVMTVHASKGLEFPVVYLMNLNKSFNLSDVRNKRYVLSKHFGLGTDLYDYTHLLKFPSLVKEAIKLERTLSLKAEEMRKLYVALTRCEQQLILVGSIGSQEKWENENQSIIESSSQDEGMINLEKRQSAMSWLAWIQQSLAVASLKKQSLAGFSSKQVTYQFFNEAEIDAFKADNPTAAYQVTGGQHWVDRVKQISQDYLSKPQDPSGLLERILDLNSSDYPYKLATNTSSYQSVSELKRLYEEPSHQQLSHFQDRTHASPALNLNEVTKKDLSDERDSKPDHALYAPDQTDSPDSESIQSIRFTGDTFQAPQFMQDQELGYAQIGSLTHYLMQHLDFTGASRASNLSEYLIKEADRLHQAGYFTQTDLNVIRFDNLVHFLESPIGQEVIAHHQSLQREQAFSYLLPADWLFAKQIEVDRIQELGDNQLLIHGIIDTYYETHQGIVILDYKTDRYRPYGQGSRQDQIKQIAEKYKFQVSLYAKALSQAQDKPVIKVALVLLDFKETYVYQDLYPFG